MTRLQQIATLILDAPYGELREFSTYIHGLESDLNDIARLHEAAMRILRSLKDAEPSQEPAEQQKHYPFTGVKYNLEAMGYSKIKGHWDCEFIGSRTPQRFDFWSSQNLYGLTPEGQSYLDEMAAQYAAEQVTKETAK